MVEFDPRMTSAEAQIALVQNWTACLEISRASVPSSFNIFRSSVCLFLSLGSQAAL